jgi:hypothetical protein
LTQANHGRLTRQPRIDMCMTQLPDARCSRYSLTVGH